MWLVTFPVKNIRQIKTFYGFSPALKRCFVIFCLVLEERLIINEVRWAFLFKKTAFKDYNLLSRSNHASILPNKLHFINSYEKVNVKGALYYRFHTHFKRLGGCFLPKN